jgi:hypothetical protein
MNLQKKNPEKTKKNSRAKTKGKIIKLKARNVSRSKTKRIRC